MFTALKVSFYSNDTTTLQRANESIQSSSEQFIHNSKDLRYLCNGHRLLLSLTFRNQPAKVCHPHCFYNHHRKVSSVLHSLILLLLLLLERLVVIEESLEPGLELGVIFGTQVAQVTLGEIRED